MDLRELYQDIILDHGRHPRNFRPIAAASHCAVTWLRCSSERRERWRATTDARPRSTFAD